MASPIWRPADTVLSVRSYKFRPQYVWTVSTDDDENSSSTFKLRIGGNVSGAPWIAASAARRCDESLLPCEMSSAELSAGAQSRSRVAIGFCWAAKLTSRRVIACDTDRGPPPRTDNLSMQWRIAAFDINRFTAFHWQHRILDAATAFGMSLPLLRALRWSRITVLDVKPNALFSQTSNIIIWKPNASSIQSEHVALPAREHDPPTIIRNFVLAVALPPSTAASRGRAVDGTYPSYAYWPFREARPFREAWHTMIRHEPERHAGHAAVSAASGSRQVAAPSLERRSPLVVFLSREGERYRTLVNESAIVHSIGGMLRARGFRFMKLGGRYENQRSGALRSPPPASFFRGVSGVIGVHGGALANVHACAQGTRVVEIIGYSPRGTHRGIRLYYAALSAGLGHQHYLYVPRVWPAAFTCRPPLCRMARDSQRVIVDLDDFRAFVEHVFPPVL